ncbi:MAG: hypothetical protein DIU78_006775 [Pseudomonadota bacterium]|nr:MAG: hypothetical protein DIU78_07975 [Pseudomonadota bacterium]
MRRVKLVALGFSWCAVLPCTASAADAAEPSRATAVGSGRGYAHLFGGVAFGRGLRFNNPYRLATQLGETERSLSLTASYADVSAGASFGSPNGFRHGAVAHLSIAVEGIAQEVGSLSYVLLHPIGRDALVLARAGVPLVLRPDATTGGELAAGATWFFSGGLGLSAELVGTLFLGAPTWERDPSAIPILSLQLGVWTEYEVLP